MGLIDSILGFFVNRDIDKLQNSEEWKKNINKINSNRIKMDASHMEHKQILLKRFTENKPEFFDGNEWANRKKILRKCILV